LVLFTTLAFSKRHPVYSEACWDLIIRHWHVPWPCRTGLSGVWGHFPLPILRKFALYGHGVGLDDTFVYTRVPTFEPIPEFDGGRRIEETMTEWVCLSPSSITTMVAFVLGSMRCIPESNGYAGMPLPPLPLIIFFPDNILFCGALDAGRATRRLSPEFGAVGKHCPSMSMNVENLRWASIWISEYELATVAWTAYRK
jgi:hypothetical protein